MEAPFLDRGKKIVAARVSDSEPTARWQLPEDLIYFAREDETPNKIARMFGVNVDRVVKLNEHYEGLIPSSKLKGGTRIELPPRDLRWMLTEQLGKGVKVDKKKRYTLRDIEPEILPAQPGDEAPRLGPGKQFESIESKRVQEYPQPNNSYTQNEVVCALWPTVEEGVVPDPANNNHWLTEFSYAVYQGPVPGDPSRARLKYENDKYTLDHQEPDKFKVVPKCVIIKREKEKGGGDGDGRGGEGAAEIHILDPFYEGLGMRKFLYDSMTKKWHDSMDKNRRVHFRVFFGPDKGAAAAGGGGGRRRHEYAYAEEAAPPTPPPSPPRWTEDQVRKRCEEGDAAGGAQGLWVSDLAAESEGMAWETAAEAGTEEERAQAEGKPHMEWWYKDLGGAFRSWTARRPIDTLCEPAPYVVLW